MNTIKQATAQFMYEQFENNYPVIVAAVRELLAKGETPDRIHKFFQLKLGRQSQTAAHIGLVADYLASA